MKNLFYEKSVKGMRKIVFLLLGVILLFSVSCSSDDNDSTESSKPIFLLYISAHTGDYDSKTLIIDVDFLCAYPSVIPEVTINGNVMTNFDIDDGGIWGSIDIPYSNTIDYSVSADGKTTSGSITIPQEPYNVICNGVLLEEDSYNYIPASNSFNFSWICNNYDYFKYYWDSSYEWIRGYILDPNISFYADGSNYYYFDLRSRNGVLLEPGATPNVEGEYGNGYVVATCDGLDFTIQVESGRTENSKLVKPRISEEVRHEELKEKFNLIIEYNKLHSNNSIVKP